MGNSIGIGLLGYGTVGSGLFENLARNGELLRERLGIDLRIERIAVRDTRKERTAPAELFTTDIASVIGDPRVRIVVELMGGMDVARGAIESALRADKVVVTGNKALLAEHGAEIFALSEELSVPVFFEASTAGGIPIIKAVREAFVANHFLSFHGIINGTSNYILSRMTEAGLDFPAALAEAQAHGYAEADPTLDVNGWDAAHKAIILASLAYGRWVRPDSISVEGIEKVSAADIRFARQLGYRIKLIGRITADAQGTISVGVHPTLIPQEHVLASVNGVFNAIAVKGDVVGDALFYGRGAGSGPTASAVLADIADAATALVNRGTPRCSGFRAHGLYGEALSPDEVVSRYYLRLAVDDQPGVLGQVAGALGRAGIGISSALQPEQHDADDRAQLILMLDRARHAQVKSALAEIESMTSVRPPAALLRVESFA